MSLTIYRVEFVVLLTGELRGWLGPVHIMNHHALPSMELILWLHRLRKTNLNPYILLNVAPSPAQPGSLTREPGSCLAHLSTLLTVVASRKPSQELCLSWSWAGNPLWPRSLVGSAVLFRSPASKPYQSWSCSTAQSGKGRKCEAPPNCLVLPMAHQPESLTREIRSP